MPETTTTEDEAVREARRLLGWAEFNLTKGKTEAALTLIRKALDQLDETREEEIAAAEHEAAREEHYAEEDKLWHPLHDTTEESDGLR